VSTPRYSAGLEPVGKVEARATSKSAISHRFIQRTEQKLAELFGRDLSQLDLVAMFIDASRSPSTAWWSLRASMPRGASIRSACGRHH